MITIYFYFLHNTQGFMTKDALKQRNNQNLQ